MAIYMCSLYDIVNGMDRCTEWYGYTALITDHLSSCLTYHTSICWLFRPKKNLGEGIVLSKGWKSSFYNDWEICFPILIVSGIGSI
jgi:hypothetical protein